MLQTFILDVISLILFPLLINYKGNILNFTSDIPVVTYQSNPVLIKYYYLIFN